QETLAPPAYGEDQATREETTTFDATSPREEPSMDPMQRGEDGLTYIDPNTMIRQTATPASPAPALRGTVPPTVPTTVTIDEEGELECSLDGIPHSSTDGSLSLLEVGAGLTPTEERVLLREYKNKYLRAAKDEQRSHLVEGFLSRDDLSEEIKKLWSEFVETCSTSRITREQAAEAALRKQEFDRINRGQLSILNDQQLLNVAGFLPVKSTKSLSETNSHFNELINQKYSYKTIQLIAPLIRSHASTAFIGLVNFVPTASFCYRDRLITIGFPEEERRKLENDNKMFESKNLAKVKFTVVGLNNEYRVVSFDFLPQTFLGDDSSFISSWDSGIKGSLSLQGVCSWPNLETCKKYVTFKMGAIGTRFGPLGLFDPDVALEAGNKNDFGQYCLKHEAILKVARTAYIGATEYYHSEQGILNNMRDDLRQCVEGDPAQSYFFENFKIFLGRGCIVATAEPILNVHILTQRSPCSVCSASWFGAIHSPEFLLGRLQACFQRVWTSSKDDGSPLCVGAAPNIRLTGSFEANELYDVNEHISFKGFQYYFDNNVEEAMATTVAG
ncbi:MAG: hypothetical protein Q8Q56_01390, partial [Alphaproteobacteria bacterium]|nr:hypothetical protein [Alphaproteobacteria bacterium]